MKTSEILTKAAEVMIERGHGKGDFFTDDGHVCLLGSVMAALGYGSRDELVWDEGYYVEYRSSSRCIEGVLGSAVIGGWNDREETTEAMALGVLHEAALLAKEQGD